MKKNNKGFSLVELIIVIAIMAILAGALAPALIKYINKSRRSTDVQNADSLRTAIQTALSNPEAADKAPSGAQNAKTYIKNDDSADAFQKEVYSIVGKADLTTKYKPKSNGPTDSVDMYFKIDMANNTVQVFAGNPSETAYELSPSTCEGWSK